MKGWWSRIGVRGRLLLAVLVIVAVALVGAGVAFNLLLTDILSSDVDERLKSMVDDYVAGITVTDRGIKYPSASGDFRELGSQVFVVVEGAIRAGPNASPSVQQAARGLHGQPAQYVELEDEQVRLYGVPLYHEGTRIGTIVAGLYTGSYARTQTIALMASTALTGFVLILVGFIIHWILGAAFRPVVKMTADAEAWSTADLDRRFEMGEPHDEVTQLAHTLDGMLDRIAASLRREQRFSAEVSHQLRTPVAKIKAEAELALRRERDPAYYQESLASISHGADQMAATVETLLAASLEEGSLARGRADARKVMDDVVTSVEVLAARNSVNVSVEPLPREMRVGVGRDIATQIIQPVVENACRFARTKVVVAAARNGKEISFTVVDDGPGVAEDEKDRIFEPGVRGSAAETGRGTYRGAGLGLSLARRLARAASGDVEVTPGSTGAKFVVRLPAG